MPHSFQSSCRHPRLTIAALGLVAAVAVGCATGQQLEIKKTAVSAHPPANVAFYLKVMEAETHQPVVLTSSDFGVVEDGKVVSSKKGKRTLAPAKTVVDRFVLVMVDLSGAIVDSEYLPNLRDSIRAMLARLSRQAHVGLIGYDGTGPVPFLTFEDDDQRGAFENLRQFRPRERDSDLWGAFLTGLDTLNEAVAKSQRPFKEGSLVVITDRPDKAGKHSREEALDRAVKSANDVYVVGIGDRIIREELERIGKTHAEFAREQKDLGKAISATTKAIDDKMSLDYVFSYCSPKRRGNHDVELRIETPKWHGNVMHRFSAKGFGKGCDPKTKPDFQGAGGDIAGDVDTSDGGGDDEDEPQKSSRKKKKKKKAKTTDADGEDDES